MIVTLRLEAVADHLADMNAAVKHRPELRRRIPVRLWKYTYGPARRPWVARITGVGPDGRLERKFLDGQKDFSDASGSDEGCSHPADERVDLTEMGGPIRYLCRVCGQEITVTEREDGHEGA